MRQPVSLFIALLLSVLPIPTPAQAPGPGDFAAYLRESGLTQLHVAELRSTCLDGGNLSACQDYLTFLKDYGEFDRAIAFTDSLKRDNSRVDLPARLMKAEAFINASRLNEANILLDEIIASLPPDTILAEAVFLRAECRFRLGHSDDVLINLHVIGPYMVGVRPVEFTVLLGECEEANGNLSEARTLYEEALELGSGSAALGLLRCDLREGDVSGFFELHEDVSSRGVLLPSMPACELAVAVGELLPEVWRVLIQPVITDSARTSPACGVLVNSLVDLAESGEAVHAYCDSLMAADMEPGLERKLRYAWALSLAEPSLASDSLAALAGRVSDADLKLRCAAGALLYASDRAKPVLVEDLVPGILKVADRLSGDERLELASLLVDCDVKDEGFKLASDLLDELEPCCDNAAMAAIATLFERGGGMDMAFDVSEMVGSSIIPTKHSLEGRKKAYMLEQAISTSTATAGLAAEVERMAREGASEFELGDLFMKLEDYQRASAYYRKAMASSPRATQADAIKLKLIQSLGREWLEKADDECRREALDLVDEIADSATVDAGTVRKALDLATDWLRLDHDRALRIAQKLCHRDRVSSDDLYESGRILYSLFLQQDGNVYTECVLTLKRLLSEFPTSSQAPAAALLLGSARLVAGDYVGGLEAYRLCVERSDDRRIRTLAMKGMGQCYLYSGGITDALRHFKQAGHSPAVMYNIARCYELRGQVDSAEVYYGRSLARLSDPAMADAARLRLSLHRLERDGLDASMDELDSPLLGVRSRLKDVRRIARAYALGESGYQDLAAALLKHYSDREDTFSCETLLLAASLIASDDPGAAVAALEPGRHRCDDIFGVFGLLYDRASHVCSQGPYDACSGAAQTFRQRFPLAERGQLGIASKAALLLFRDGKGDSAAAMVDSLVATGRTHPALAQAVYTKGVHHMVQGEHARAVRAFRLIEQDYRQHDLYHDTCFKLGTAYYMMGRYDSSAVYFRIASQSEKASLIENAFFNLGLALEKHGDLAGSARAFWSLAMRFPMSERFERSLMRCAYAYERIGKLEEAARVYKGLLHYAEDPETAAEAMYWMGETYSEMGKHLGAAIEFLRVGHMFPEETAWAGTARYRAGVECEKIGLIGHAATIYEQNVARFGTGTDWGNASEERLTLLRGGTIEPRNPTTQHNEDD